jgi:hypothetical protein
VQMRVDLAFADAAAQARLDRVMLYPRSAPR